MDGKKPLGGTISPVDAAGRKWDAIIVGAGPAGSSAAIGLARQSLAVLLVDKASFPRGKVCGCCLNPTSLGALADLGLGDPVNRLGARSLHELRLAAGGRVARIDLAEGAALSRERLDAELVSCAIQAGAHFLPRTLATPGPGNVTTEHRTVQLGHEGKQVTAAAQVVLAADGLAGRFLADEPGFAVHVVKGSLMGVGATLALERGAISERYQPGIIYMACGWGGYVGLTRLEDDRLDIAAALKPGMARRAGGLAALVGAILREAGLPAPCDLDALEWHGTPQLTRRRAVAGNRLLVLGDAAGYVEPFTGEGIGWALTAGRAIVPLIAAVKGWSPTLADKLGSRNIAGCWAENSLPAGG